MTAVLRRTVRTRAGDRCKGPNLTGIDPDTGEVCRLFHPRRDVWIEHFSAHATRLDGLTPIGRTTVWVLNFNSREQLRLRTLARIQ